MRTTMASSEIVASPAHLDAVAMPARAVKPRTPPPGRPMRNSAARAPDGKSDTARLAAALAQERHVTLELQRAILPLHEGPFDLPGLRAVVRYLPASHDSRVGGDWYITAEMPGGHVLLAIGDVGGHGLAAAAGMARLRGALAGLAITGSPPERLVGWLNDLVHHVGPEHTASVVAGYFDPPTRVLTWAQAGHPPPVLVRDATAQALGQPAGHPARRGPLRLRGRVPGAAARRSAAALQRRPDRAQGPPAGGRAGRAHRRRRGQFRPGTGDRRRARQDRLGHRG